MKGEAMARVMIRLETDEREALLILSQREKRDPRQQAALLIRFELERMGLLPVVNASPTERNAAQQTGATQNAIAA